MTKEDIIRMAEQCGIPEFENNESVADNILRFFNLATAHEREQCAKVCEAHAKVYLLIESPIANAGWSACIDNRDAIKARGQA